MKLTYNDFMSAIISHFGSYPSALTENITLEYVMEKFKEDQLYDIYKKIISSIDQSFRKPPSIFQFEELFFKKSDAEYEIEANAAWNDLQRYSSHYDAICSDIRVQLAIETAFGSWEQFGQRLTKYEALHHKNFTEAFVRFSKFRQDIQPSLMRGGGNYFTPPPPQLIGDKEKCRMLLSERKNENLKIIENMVGGMRV